MNTQERETKLAALGDLKTETMRLLERIKEASDEIEFSEWPNNKKWTAVKRASLDLNLVGVKVRKL